MKKYLNDYIDYVDKCIEEKKVNEEFKKEHLVKIDFFKHERLIHLLVTLFYALYVFIALYFSIRYPAFLIIFFLFLIILLFYVIHYFRLENGVQYLYKEYDKICEIIGEK